MVVNPEYIGCHIARDGVEKVGELIRKVPLFEAIRTDAPGRASPQQSGPTECPPWFSCLGSAALRPFDIAQGQRQAQGPERSRGRASLSNA